jgi:hypothetical protein
MWILDYTQLDLAILLYYYTTADKFEQLRRLILPKKSRIISEKFLDKFLALIRPACHAPVHALFYPGLVVDLPVLLHSIAPPGIGWIRCVANPMPILLDLKRHSKLPKPNRLDLAHQESDKLH